MSTTDQPGPHPEVPLPVWRLIKASYASVFRHRDNFVGRAWPWVAVVAVLTVLFGLVLGMEFEENSTATLIISLAIGIGGTMMVVSWHRGLLLGEPGGPGTAFRLDRPFWRYVGVCILLALIFGLGIGLLVALFAMPLAINAERDAAVVGVSLIAGVGVFAIIPFAGRTMVALPMAAIDAAPPLIRGAWRLTRGNTWRLAGAMLLTYLFAALIQYGATVVVARVFGLLGAGDYAYLAIQPLIAALGLMLAALFASLASYVYAVLTDHPLAREVAG